MDNSKNHSLPLDLKYARILTFYDRIKAILRGEIPYPRMAIIYPIYGCNYDCVGCEYSPLNSKPTKLQFNRFISLIDELVDVGVEGVEFCGGGEPTLYPKLDQIISYGKSKGLKFGILTNGTMSESIAEFLAKNLSYIRITMNAGTEQTYISFQRPKIKNAWQVIQDRIKIINSVRKKYNPELIFGMKVVIGKTNISDLHNMVAFAKQMGFDNIQIKCLRQSPDELEPQQEKYLSEQIENLRSSNGFNIIYSPKMSIERKCILTPLQTTIDARGDVFLCCYFSYREEQHRIGNIYEKTFKEIWGSEAHRAKIKSIVPQMCNMFDCRFIRYHKVVEDLIENNKGQFQFI
ncbi:MAG: radical SAM protein [bacterium]|nr:radical SAM protein [bacterium]